MFKNFIRILSLVLIVSLLWNMLPVSVLGADLREALSADEDAVLVESESTSEMQEPEEITILGELTDRRTENIKEYLLSNGNTLAAVYGNSVHYQEDGQWKEIDNTLIAKNGTYVNTAGLLRVSFPQNLNGNNYITVTKDGYTLSFGMAGQLRDGSELVAYGAVSRALTQPEVEISVSAAKTALAQLHAVDFAEAKEAAKYPELVQEKLSSRLSYSNVYDDTNITYDLDSNRVKESVILSRYDATLRGYRYTLQTGDMVPVLAEDGHIDFYDARGEEIILTMPAPFLVDADFVYNWDIDVTLTGGNGTYTLTYLLPQSWLAAEDRAWPVVLDPVVEVEASATTIADQTIFSGGSQAYTWNYLQCGYDTSKAISRIYLKFSAIPQLTSADVIVNAEVSLHKPASSSSAFYVDVHGVNGSWSSSGITWSNKPGFDANATDFVMVKNAGDYTWNVTDIAREWYQTNTNYGMVFKASDTVEGQTGTNNYVQFYSSNHSAFNPQLTIEYRNTTGLEDYWDYTSASAGRAGTAYVNNSAGNLVFARNLMAFGGNRMPVSIDLVYNASEKGNNSFGLGNGWRTNYHQTVEMLEGAEYYIWTDADGTQHYFKLSYDDGRYYDKDNLNLTLMDNGNTKEIKDLTGNTITFDSSGRLIQLANFQATKSYINITYNTDNQIAQITDGVNRVYTFTYTSEQFTKISYTSTGASEIRYVIISRDASGNITQITDNDAACTYAYSNNLLTKASDPQGVGLTFTYQSESPNRITQVKEHDGNTFGNYIGFSYGNKWTRLEDKQENVQYMLFNAHGNTVSVQDDNGSAVFAEYATDISEIATKNQLTLSANLQGTTVDLLINGNFEKDTGFTITGDESSGFIDYGFSGSRALYIEAGSDVGTVEFDDFVIAPGETYTLSAYINVCYGSANLSLNNENGPNAVSPSLTSFDANQWKRLAVTYTNTTDSNITVTPMICVESGGVIYIDGVQLEKSAKTGMLNLLENGDFTVASSNAANYEWTHSNLTSDDGRKTLTTASAASVMDSNVMKIIGSPTAQKRVSQQVNVSGNAGDVFTLAGWGKGYVSENGETYYGERKFGLELTIHNTDGTITTKSLLFSPHLENWQYIAGQVVADKAYDYVEVALVCDYNVNTAHFDGIQLFNEGFGTTYTYNDNGDVATVTNAKGETTSYTYNFRRLITNITNHDGSTVAYTYNSYHNITTETVTYPVESADEQPTTRTTAYTYDTYGNPIKTVTSIGETSYETSATYTNNGNYLTSATDEKGTTTTYTYNADTGVLTSVKDPANNSTNYEYDSLGRTKKVAQGTGADVPNVSFAYIGDWLSDISTPSTNYTFTYGTFGAAQTVEAGGYTLATYTYNGNRNLSNLAYGNGAEIAYTYDVDGRVTTEQYINGNETDTITYTYDEIGRVIRVDDGISNQITTYSYDTQNRIVDMEAKAGNTSLHSIHYTYNADGQLAAKTISFGTQTPTTSIYHYNELHQLTRVSSAGVVQNTEYNDWGLPSQTVIRSGNNNLVTQQYTYSSVTELNEHIINYGTTQNTYTYAYDSRGNIREISICSTGSGTTETKVITYVYDAYNQLIRENNQLANRTWVMTYDTAGNMLSRKAYCYTTAQTPSSEITGERKVFTYGDSTWKDRLTGINGAGVTSDTIGNILSDGTNTYTWRNGRQLATMSKSGVTWSFAYDASGMRTSRTSGSTAYAYTYDGGQLKKMTVGSNALIFTYGINGQPMSVKYNGVDYYYVTNSQGDVVSILNSSGTEVVTYIYDAWGNILSTSGSMASTLGAYNPLRYRGYVYDRETGLYYLQSRYYNPTIGRFISADTFVSTGQGVLGYNMFAYCNNNPVMGYDPSGKIPVLLTLALGIIAVAATINDIKQIPNLELEEILSIDRGDKIDNVRIKDSYRILTPWMQFGYGLYLNYIDEQTRDIIDGTTVGVTYEWLVHNVAYAVSFIPGLDSFRASAESVDIGRTVFADPHEGFKGHALKIPYLVFLFPVAVVDLFINGGYR